MITITDRLGGILKELKTPIMIKKLDSPVMRGHGKRFVLDWGSCLKTRTP